MFLFICFVYNIMKGGSVRKKVILKFIGTGINNNYQACVKIYDRYKNIIYQGKSYNGKLVLYLENNSAYSIIATSYGRLIRNAFYVGGCDDVYVFSFASNKEINLKTVTFLLRDANYDDLHIKKGEMFLWQKQ